MRQPGPRLWSTRPAQRNTARGIHVQKTNRCSSNGRLAAHVSLPQFEMFVPVVFAWIKQRRHSPSVRINASQGWSFVRIASIARERETGRVVGTTVLLRQDVLQVKRDQGRCRLVKAAILTRVPGSVANQFASSLIQPKRPAAKGSGAPLPALWRRCRRPRRSLCIRHPRRA